MRRREFIFALGGAAVWPFTAGAQQVERVRRIGILTSYAETDPEPGAWIAVFRQQLESLGWREGQKIRFDIRWGAGNLDQVRVFAAELVRLTPDVVVAEGTPLIAALQKETRAIPIVFVGGSNLVGSGFVASLAHPGGNVTGFISYEPTIGGKWVEVLKEIAPAVVRVALIYNPRTHSGQYFQSIQDAARSHGVGLVWLPFATAADIERGLDEFAREPNGGMVVLSDPGTSVPHDLIVSFSSRYLLPAVYSLRQFTIRGGLISYGPDRKDQYRRAADYVDRILKGEKPADLPVQVPTKYELVVNVKTAKALGLEVPPTLLARADEVVE